MTAHDDHDADEMASHIVVKYERVSRLEREKSSFEARVSELLAIGRRCAGQLRDGPSAVEHGNFLYDEHGLPK